MALRLDFPKLFLLDAMLELSFSSKTSIIIKIKRSVMENAWGDVILLWMASSPDLDI